MKKRNQVQVPAVRKETLHKILYALMLQKAAKQKLKKALVAAEN
jgi:hypothetical protein